MVEYYTTIKKIVENFYVRHGVEYVDMEAFGEKEKPWV